MGRIVTLTTDFGQADEYVASVKAVILSINPAATVVDITHAVPSHDVLHGAYVLSTAWPHFPLGSVHIAVVDPGVGSNRKAIGVTSNSHYFVGPDNGILSLAAPEDCVVRELTNECLHLETVSSTFHARDIFGPVAAHLSLGIPFQTVGPTVDTINRLPVPPPSLASDNSVQGTIIHIDKFGNAITNIRHDNVSSDEITISIGREVILGISPSYATATKLLAIWGSSGRLEISMRNGNAADALGLNRGDSLTIHDPGRRQ